jgi:hypothetical protein
MTLASYVADDRMNGIHMKTTADEDEQVGVAKKQPCSSDTTSHTTSETTAPGEELENVQKEEDQFDEQQHNGT